MAAPDKQNSASPPDKPNSFRVGTPISENVIWQGNKVCLPTNFRNRQERFEDRKKPLFDCNQFPLHFQEIQPSRGPQKSKQLTSLSRSKQDSVRISIGVSLFFLQKKSGEITVFKLSFREFDIFSVTDICKQISWGNNVIVTISRMVPKM